MHRYADDAAAASGWSALLLHGFLDTGNTWDEVGPRLAAAGMAVYAPDLRGFGASDRVGPGGYYHFPDYVADVDALVRGIAADKLLLVGHSMGGTVACLYAGARPERVQALALIEGVGPPAMPPDAGLHRMRQWLGDLEKPRPERALASVEDAAHRLAQYNPHVPPEILARRAEQGTAHRDDGTVAWAYDPLHRTISPMPFSLPLFHTFLGQIRAPALFVGGGPKGFHPEDEDERLKTLRARRLDLPEAGHVPHWIAPDAVARAILDLCNSATG